MAMTRAERQRRYMKRLKAASAMKACPHCGKPLAALPGRERPAAHKAKPKTTKAQAAQP
jgi:ribosomal protein L32